VPIARLAEGRAAHGLPAGHHRDERHDRGLAGCERRGHRDTVKLFLLGLPMLLAGTWVGMKLYGRLDEASFRKVVLILLLISGMLLVVPVSGFG